MGQVETLDRPDSQVHQDKKDRRDSLGLKAVRDRLDKQDLRDPLVLMDRPDLTGVLGQRVLPDNLVLPDLREIQDLRDRQGPVGSSDNQDQPVSQDLLVQRETQGQRVNRDR